MFVGIACGFASARTDRDELMSYNAVVYTDVTARERSGCAAAGHLYSEGQVEHPGFASLDQLQRKNHEFDACRHALAARATNPRFAAAYAVVNRAYSYTCDAVRRDGLAVSDCPAKPLVPEERAGPDPLPPPDVVYVYVDDPSQ
jgi:hypothetical protein